MSDGRPFEGSGCAAHGAAESGGRYIQVGVTALRDPVTGKMLPAVPLYIQAPENATEEQELEPLAEGIAHLLALRMKQYIDGCKAAGIEI